MADEQLDPASAIEQRLAHLEQMVKLFGKHTDIHMRSTSDMQKHITNLNEKFAELQRVVDQQNGTISILLDALLQVPSAAPPSASDS